MATVKSKADSNPNPHLHLKHKICVSGAADTEFCAPDALEKAMETGRQVVSHGAILVTGATTGIPLWAARGAKEAGGFVVGYSPASSEVEHVKKYRLPLDYHDVIVYTGFGYSGRNLLLTRASDAVIIICGRIGTLNEFTIAFEDEKPIGVVEGTGIASDYLRGLISESHRGQGKVVFESDPKILLEKVLVLVAKEKTKEI